jgi:hypothetical protein
MLGQGQENISGQGEIVSIRGQARIRDRSGSDQDQIRAGQGHVRVRSGSVQDQVCVT